MVAPDRYAANRKDRTCKNNHRFLHQLGMPPGRPHGASKFSGSPYRAAVARARDGLGRQEAARRGHGTRLMAPVLARGVDTRAAAPHPHRLSDFRRDSGRHGSAQLLVAAPSDCDRSP